MAKVTDVTFVIILHEVGFHLVRRLTETFLAGLVKAMVGKPSGKETSGNL